MTIEFCWRLIFEILIIHKPFMGSCEVPHKIWVRSFQLFLVFIGYKQTNKQTDKQSINRDGIFVRTLLIFFIRRFKFKGGQFSAFQPVPIYFPTSSNILSNQFQYTFQPKPSLYLRIVQYRSGFLKPPSAS